MRLFLGILIGAALTILSPFIPLLFQGEEWNTTAPFQYFTDHQDPRMGDGDDTEQEHRSHEPRASERAP